MEGSCLCLPSKDIKHLATEASVVTICTPPYGWCNNHSQYSYSHKKRKYIYFDIQTISNILK